MDEDRVPPLSAEGVLDVVQALGALTSDTPGQREFGEAVRRLYFDELPKTFAGDARASAYLREVLAGAAAAVRGFSVERTRFKAARAREQKIQGLRERILEPRLLSSPFAEGKGSTAFAVLVNLLPPSVLLWVRTGFETLPPAWFALVAVLWVLFGNVLATTVIAVVQAAAFRLAGDAERETAARWKRSMPRYKAMAVDVLITAERARGRLYPGAPALLDSVDLNSIPAADLGAFLLRPNESLGDRSPADALSRIVDLHFGLDEDVQARYQPSRKDDRPFSVPPRPGTSIAGGR